MNPVGINNTFKTFYSKLYSSEFPENDSDMLDFLDKLVSPSLDSDKRKNLNGPLTLEEVINSITAMQSGNARRPDGYPVEFYKKFSVKLAPLLLEMFDHSLV